MLLAMSPGVRMDQVLLILHRRQEISKILIFEIEKLVNWYFWLTFVNVCSHEYQIIMSIIWKRINDTGKNWRHVYKVCIFITCCLNLFLMLVFFLASCWIKLATCLLSTLPIISKSVSFLDFLLWIRRVNNSGGLWIW